MPRINHTAECDAKMAADNCIGGCPEFPEPDVASMEQIIRDLAATVIANVDNRVYHPTFGVTKTMIRDGLVRMDGAIGMYMILTEQSAHAHATALAKFKDDDTKILVRRARTAAANRVGVYL